MLPPWPIEAWNSRFLIASKLEKHFHKCLKTQRAKQLAAIFSLPVEFRNEDHYSKKICDDLKKINM